jgi:hypothetical protein
VFLFHQRKSFWQREQYVLIGFWQSDKLQYGGYIPDIASWFSPAAPAAFANTF